MESERRKRLTLIGAIAAIGIALAYELWPASGAAPAAAPSSTGARGAPSGPAATGVAVPDVRIHALEAARPEPIEAERNLFRFKPRPAPPQPRTPVAPPPQMGSPGAPGAPPSTPPVPPITLKFIGVVEQAGRRLAVLSDSAGHVFHAQEGGTVDGRYRILKIGAESLEIAYLDGRDRKTIRLSGS
jgi:hypothetical protein